MRNERRVFILLIGIILAVFLSESYLFWYGHEHHWTTARMHGYFLPGIFGINPLALFSIATLSVLFYFLAANKNKDADLEVLKVKYVRGEITRDDYVRIFRDIVQGR